MRESRYEKARYELAHSHVQIRMSGRDAFATPEKAPEPRRREATGQRRLLFLDEAEVAAPSSWTCGSCSASWPRTSRACSSCLATAPWVEAERREGLATMRRDLAAPVARLRNLRVCLSADVLRTAERNPEVATRLRNATSHEARRTYASLAPGASAWSGTAL